MHPTYTGARTPACDSADGSPAACSRQRAAGRRFLQRVVLLTLPLAAQILRFSSQLGIGLSYQRKPATMTWPRAPAAGLK
jgi:hypothetical protein